MKKTKISLEEMMRLHPDKDYEQLYAYITAAITDGSLMAVKRAGTNGRTPALPNAYWRIEEEADYSEVLEELKFKLHPLLDVEYYRQHPKRYVQDREKVLLLSNYLMQNGKLLEVEETINERSFEIFHREKFFQREGGLSFCKRLGVSEDLLKFYETSEPLSYYSHSKNSPQNILITENKDTFYDIRRYMNNGHTAIMEMEFGTVIYGAGKGIYRTFQDYADGAENYFMGENRIYYFGDLDYEGIGIYEHLAGMDWRQKDAGREISIGLFTAAYERMLDKALDIGIAALPDTKEQQNTNIGNVFFQYFTEERREQMLKILENGKYVPQEILNEHDWG